MPEKLPREVISADYEKKSMVWILLWPCMQDAIQARPACIDCDSLLATGGTVKATIWNDWRLGIVAGCAFPCELDELKAVKLLANMTIKYWYVLIHVVQAIPR